MKQIKKRSGRPTSCQQNQESTLQEPINLEAICWEQKGSQSSIALSMRKSIWEVLTWKWHLYISNSVYWRFPPVLCAFSFISSHYQRKPKSKQIKKSSWCYQHQPRFCPPKEKYEPHFWEYFWKDWESSLQACGHCFIHL